MKRILFDIKPGVITGATTKLARLVDRTTQTVVPFGDATDTDVGQFTDNPSKGWANFNNSLAPGDYDFVLAINGVYGWQTATYTIGGNDTVARPWGSEVSPAAIKTSADAAKTSADNATTAATTAGTKADAAKASADSATTAATTAGTKADAAKASADTAVGQTTKSKLREAQSGRYTDESGKFYDLSVTDSPGA